MKSGTIANKNREFMRRTNGIYEALLRSEICFWQDLIAGCDPAHPYDSLERMLQAQALAESRLATLLRDNQHACTAEKLHELSSNVFSISCSSVSRVRE